MIDIIKQLINLINNKQDKIADEIITLKHITNLNDDTQMQSGLYFYQYTSTTLNIPIVNSGIALIFMEMTNYIYEYVFVGNQNCDIYVRSKYMGTWNTWKKVTLS